MNARLATRRHINNTASISCLCVVILLAFLAASCSPELKSRLWPGRDGNPAAGAQALPLTPATSDTEAGLADMAIAAILVQAGDAVLVRGSRQATGLPFLEDNYQSVLSADYLVAWTSKTGGLENHVVRVWYCQEAVILDQRFLPGACSQADARQSLLLQDQNWQVQALVYPNYYIFIAFPPDLPPVCSFVTRLAQRLAYFRSYAAHVTELSFPAVLLSGN